MLSISDYIHNFMYRRDLKVGSLGLFCGCSRQMMLERTLFCRYMQILTTNTVRNIVGNFTVVDRIESEHMEI